MPKYFDEQKWLEAIQHNDWYLLLSDDYKRLANHFYGRRAKRGEPLLLVISYLVQYSKDSPNAFRPLRLVGDEASRLRRREKPPAKIRKRGGAAPIKTAKEPIKNIGSPLKFI